MIRATSAPGGPLLTLDASVTGVAIYLDNFALIELAKGDPARRHRFVQALRAKGDLLFSASNAVDLSGPQGKSRELVRALLDEIGPHWVPVELNPFEVVDRETHGMDRSKACLSEKLMKDYFVHRLRQFEPRSGRVICLSDDFFQLGAMLDWIEDQRDSIREWLARLDGALTKTINEHRATFEKYGDQWLNHAFPILPYRKDLPATFAYVNLVRLLIVEAKSHALKAGDGLDFCHATISSAFANFATLDKHWKRRVTHLPKPNDLASIYYAPEIDKFVSDLESASVEASEKSL